MTVGIISTISIPTAIVLTTQRQTNNNDNNNSWMIFLCHLINIFLKQSTSATDILFKESIDRRITPVVRFLAAMVSVDIDNDRRSDFVLVDHIKKQKETN